MPVFSAATSQAHQPSLFPCSFLPCSFLVLFRWDELAWLCSRMTCAMDIECGNGMVSMAGLLLDWMEQASIWTAGCRNVEDERKAIQTDQSVLLYRHLLSACILAACTTVLACTLFMNRPLRVPGCVQDRLLPRALALFNHFTSSYAYISFRKAVVHAHLDLSNINPIRPNQSVFFHQNQRDMSP